MSLINPISWTIYDQVVPRDKLPRIDMSTDSAAYGTVTFDIPALQTVTSVSAKVFRLIPPSPQESR